MTKPNQSRLITALLALYLICLLAFPAFAGQQSQKVYTGNPKSMIYHNQGCRHFGCKACVMVFSSAAEAKSHGYRACKKCGG